jgi:hypothetical protein
MSNIFDIYTAAELRDIYLSDKWPDHFKNFLHERIADELLDSWLENVDHDTYMDRCRNIIEQETYGYPDSNGNEMLDFEAPK